MMKLRKIKKELVKSSALKNMLSSTSTSETSKNAFYFVFISSFVSFGVCRYM